MYLQTVDKYSGVCIISLSSARPTATIHMRPFSHAHARKGNLVGLAPERSRKRSFCVLGSESPNGASSRAKRGSSHIPLIRHVERQRGSSVCDLVGWLNVEARGRRRVTTACAYDVAQSGGDADSFSTPAWGRGRLSGDVKDCRLPVARFSLANSIKTSGKHQRRKFWCFAQQRYLRRHSHGFSGA